MKAGTLEIELITNVARLQKEMRDIKRAVGTMQDGVVGDLDNVKKATERAGGGMVSMGKSAKLSAHHMQNLGFQINDMIVGLQGGQKPLTVFMQQGSQIGGIMAQSGVGVMGMTRALLGMAGAAALAIATNPLLLALALTVGTVYGAFKLFQSEMGDSGVLKDYVATLGLTKKELKELGDVSITFGDVMKGTWKTISDALDLGPTFANLKAMAIDTFKIYLAVVKNAAAGVYAAFKGTYDGIVTNWKNFPAVVGDFAISAANATITAVEWMANKVIAALNKLSGFANSAFEAMGISTRLGQIGEIKFDRITNSFAGAGAKAADSFASSYKSAFNHAISGMDALGKTLSDNIVGAAKDRLSAKAKELIDKRTEKAVKAAKDGVAEIGKMIGSVQTDIAQIANKALADPLKAAGVGNVTRDLAKLVKEADDRNKNRSAEAARDSAEEAARILRERVISTAHEFADIVGGRFGGIISDLAEVIDGLQTGNFGRGKIGGLFNMLNKDDAGKQLIGGLGKKLDSVFKDVFGKDGVFKDALQGAGIGVGVAQLMGGGTAKSIGGAIGGAAGKMLGTAIGGPLGGAIGSVLGSIGGSLIGGAFAKTKKGSSTLGFTNGALGVTSTVGNSNSRKDASIALGGGVSDTLAQIADALGGDLSGAISTSVGMRKKSYVVDTSGQGRTKGAGVLKFADEAAAIQAAVKDALMDGVIGGISDAAKRILKSGKDLQKAIEQAADIESIPKRLKAFEDPMGAAIDDLNGKWAKTIATLREAGASSEQWAQAQKLYQYELSDVQKQTAETSTSLKDFLDSMKFGSNSPLSLRDQEANSMKALQPYLEAIDSKKSFDVDAYTQAAQTYLDIERQLGGSTSKYFDKFNMVQDYTNRGIANMGETAANVQPIVTEDPFSKATATAAQQTADATAAMAGMIPGLPDAIAAALSRYLGGAVAQPAAAPFIGTDRGFVQRVART